MTLRVRLTVLNAFAMIVVLLGIGTTLFLYLRSDLHADFAEDLERLAAAYAENVVANKLQALPLSPIPEEIESPEIYLFTANGQLLDALQEKPAPQIPALVLKQVLTGQASFDILSAELKPLWVVAFSPQPLPLERRAALHRLQNGSFVLVSANDLGMVRILERVRNSTLLWGFIGTAIVIIMAVILAGYVSRPLQQIAQVAASISVGDLSARIPDDQGNDEIARLKRQVNLMLGRLESLVESQRRFTADAAHDLRTPLAIMRGELDITLRKPRTAEQYRESLERLQIEVKNFAGLAEDLLLLSKLEAGTDTAFKQINLKQVLAQTLTTYSVAAQQQQVVFQVNIPDKLMIYGDAIALNRAISNLFNNALKHGIRSLNSTIESSIQPPRREGKQYGQIGIEVIRLQQAILIKVFDSGQGIPPAQQAMLFHRFHKGEHSSGSGLGLAIVAEVAQQHQGRVYHQSRASGGSEFIIEIPA